MDGRAAMLPFTLLYWFFRRSDGFIKCHHDPNYSAGGESSVGLRDIRVSAAQQADVKYLYTPESKTLFLYLPPFSLFPSYISFFSLFCCSRNNRNNTNVIIENVEIYKDTSVCEV